MVAVLIERPPFRRFPLGYATHSSSLFCGMGIYVQWGGGEGAGYGFKVGETVDMVARWGKQ